MIGEEDKPEKAKAKARGTKTIRIPGGAAVQGRMSMRSSRAVVEKEAEMQVAKVGAGAMTPSAMAVRTMAGQATMTTNNVLSTRSSAS